MNHPVGKKGLKAAEGGAAPAIIRCGRPLKWQDPDDFERTGHEYIERCEAEKEPLTITGLALALGMSRRMLIEYEDRPAFHDIVNLLRTHCEHYAEKAMYTGRNPGGPIFALKNYGWKDTIDLQVSPALDDAQIEKKLQMLLAKMSPDDVLELTGNKCVDVTPEQGNGKVETLDCLSNAPTENKD